MKSNICKWSSGKMTWYSWDEKCDLCGKSVYGTKEGIASSVFPDINELDLCLNCCRKLLQEKIDYQRVKEIYFKKYIAEVKELDNPPW